LNFGKLFDEYACTGRLLTVETVSMPVAKTSHVISHVTRWHDNIDVDSAYAFILRVFTVTDQHHHLNFHHHHQQQQPQHGALQLQGPLKPLIGLSTVSQIVADLESALIYPRPRR